MFKFLLVAAAVSLITVTCEDVFNYHPCASDAFFDSDLEVTISLPRGSPVTTLTCGQAMPRYFSNYNRTSPCEMTIENDLFFASRSCCGKEGNNLRCNSRIFDFDYNPCKTPEHFRFDHEQSDQSQLCGYEAMYLAKISRINSRTTCDLTINVDASLISNHCCGERQEKDMFKCAEDVRRCMMTETLALFPNEAVNDNFQHFHPRGEPRGLFIVGKANVPSEDLNAVADIFSSFLQNQYNDEVTDHVRKTIGILPVVMTQAEASDLSELFNNVFSCAPTIENPSFAGFNIWPYPTTTLQSLLEQQFSVLQVVRWALHLPYEWAFGHDSIDPGSSLLMEEMEKARRAGSYDDQEMCKESFFDEKECMLNEFFAFAMLTNMGADLSELPTTLTDKWGVRHIDDVPSLKNLLRTPLFGLPTTMPELQKRTTNDDILSTGTVRL